MTYEVVVFDGLESVQLSGPGKVQYPIWWTNFHDALHIAYERQYPTHRKNFLVDSLSNFRNTLSGLIPYHEFQNEVLKNYNATFMSKEYFNKDNETCNRDALVFDTEQDFLIFVIKYS